MMEKTAIKMSLDPNKPEGNRKVLGGGKADEWNDRLSNLTVNALPIAHSKDTQNVTEAFLAVSYGVMDMAPADPVEGILIAQLMAANEAALTLYRKGWQNVNVPEYFEGGTKFLQLADKATRTVALLTERLDHHRGRGQQQITVKHVTTNNVTADQAIIAECFTTGGGRAVSPPLLAASSETPMPILDETRLPDPAGVGGCENEMSINPMQSAHDAPRCKAKSKRTGKPCRAPAVRGHGVCRMHGAKGGAPTGKRNGNYRHGMRTKETIQATHYVNLLSRLARKT